MTLKLRFRKSKTRSEVLINVSKLDDQCTQATYQVEVKNRFDALQRVEEPNSPDELWKGVKAVLKEAAQTVIPKKHTKKQYWISDESYELIQKKRMAKLRCPDEYKKLKREVQGMLRRDKQKELDELCTTLEKNSAKGNSIC